MKQAHVRANGLEGRELRSVVLHLGVWYDQYDISAIIDVNVVAKWLGRHYYYHHIVPSPLPFQTRA